LVSGGGQRFGYFFNSFGGRELALINQADSHVGFRLASALERREFPDKR
jgi:hypothetical protein